MWDLRLKVNSSAYKSKNGPTKTQQPSANCVYSMASRRGFVKIVHVVLPAKCIVLFERKADQLIAKLR